MKILTEHKVTKLNRECVEVIATDDVDSDGAHHRYQIILNKPGTDEMIGSCLLHFQKGGLADVGVNGITDQALIAIVLDRMLGFQSGPFACDDNKPVIAHLQRALDIMEARAAERAARGVEGVRTA